MTYAPNARPPAIEERVRRWALLLSIGALHLLAIMWLASQAAAGAAPREVVARMVDIGPASPTPAPAPEKPAKATVRVTSPLVLARSLSALVNEAPAEGGGASPSSPASGAGSGSCALALAIGDAILGNAAAMAEVEALPPQARTEADAVMLWDGAWPTPALSPANSDVPRSAVRQTVELAISSAPPECRDAMVAGPRFIALPGALRTTMIVVGSGQWRWSDLLSLDAACTPGTAVGTCGAAFLQERSSPNTN